MYVCLYIKEKNNFADDRKLRFPNDCIVTKLSFCDKKIRRLNNTRLVVTLIRWRSHSDKSRV